MYSINKSNNSFVIYKNGEPLRLPKSDGSYLLVEFDNQNDAEGYIFDVVRLSKQKKYRSYDD